jgi:2-methylisocitrate lyase-like PEP mutase family enzyme
VNATDLARKARALLELHSADRLLVLPNVWDPIGARVLASKGYPAVATASAAVSASLGFQDGERITGRTMLEVVSRISRAVEVPVAADMEAGYGATEGDLADTIQGLLDAGAVGVNLEDSVGAEGLLRSPDQQAGRIARAREVAAGRGVHLVINARIDSFFSDRLDTMEERIEDAVARAEIYARAGADCIYPIGPGDETTLTALRRRIALPMNALATPAAVPLDGMARIGINRVTFGPFLFRSCLRKFADIADDLAAMGGYESCGREMMSRSEVAAYLSPSPEDASD